MMEKPRFIILSTHGELLDLAIWLQEIERYEVVLCVTNSDSEHIGDGIVEKETTWVRYMGLGYIWCIDGCENADLQDWLRDEGEYVVGTNTEMAEMENDRQKGQAWFKRAGFNQPYSDNFTDFDSALDFIEKNSGTKYILKQNGNAPKHLNHKQKFDSGEDMTYHLEQLAKSWNEAQFGPVDFDLMEQVEGTEVAASAFFNGEDFLRNQDGKVVGYLNFEEKKEKDDNLGSTTGEMGTIFLGVDEDNNLFKDIILRPELLKELRDSDFRGVFDINGSITDKGYVVFEATSRFGVPATSYEFTEGLDCNTGELLVAMACGENTPIEVKRKWGIAQVVVAPPFPVSEEIADHGTSLGKKLWILDGKKPAEDFTKSQLQHIHLENFKWDEDGYKVATKDGYMLVVTQTGKSIDEVRQKSLDYIKENIHLENMSYRQDLGKRIDKKIIQDYPLTTILPPHTIGG